ncbi:LIP-domain-containing protein [Aspergillus affinis]|uniref:LIP-domain-containing protein n=1 Tax=Aspergillus affinis TaxID=1070780 RepID=UPI0022FF1C46|nr:LIP-domain-containing protein [Aspergillus affinis]KAI9040383.1 LIP-domain-containing protein [Aspergillus affinis]
MIKSLLSLLPLLLTLGHSLPTLDLRAFGPVPPSEHPFYQPPNGYEDQPAGTVLASREVPHPIAGLLNRPIKLSNSYQLLYRSTDSFNNATATTTTVLVPENADTTKLLSYQMPEGSPYVNCAPSYALQQNADNDGILGWIVSIPDFEGPHGAFLANNRAGYAVLDGIRAVLASPDLLGVTSDADITMWGYSGGSLATGFAAELQPSYARELQLAGAALGGVIGNLQTTTDTLIEDEVTDDPVRRKKFFDAREQCLVPNILDFQFEDVLSYYKDHDIQSNPIFQRVYRENELGQHTPGIPLFVYKGTLDEVSPINATTALVDQYCADGVSVEYKETVTHEHALLEVDGFAEASLWLTDRMNGVPAEERCTHSKKLAPLTEPGTLNVLGTTVIAELKQLLGL